MFRYVLIILFLLLQACATVSSVPRPMSYYDQNQNKNSEEDILSETIFGDNDKKINELLLYQVKLPQENRIAVLKLSRDNYWRFYSNDFNTLNDSIVEKFIKNLRSSPRVYDASFLPAMLVPEKRTLPILREAAARYQADLLLAYRSSCNSYNKYNFLADNETMSYCSVEAVLLDVRSGIIVNSVVSTENFSAKENENDKNFSETVKKAELEALSKSLGNVANAINDYLADVKIIGENS